MIFYSFTIFFDFQSLNQQLKTLGKLVKHTFLTSNFEIENLSFLKDLKTEAMRESVSKADKNGR